MMKDEYPEFFVEVFKGLDGRGNPWNLPVDQRLEWLRGLDVEVPTLGHLQAQGANPAGEHVDYLFWVGCAVAFEPRNQRAARALIRAPATRPDASGTSTSFKFRRNATSRRSTATG